MKLLKVGEPDVGESKLLDVEYGAVRLGIKGGGKGPTSPERQRTSHDKELEAARKLGEEMCDFDGRIIDAESSHRPSPVKHKRGDKPKRKRGTRQQPRNANRQDTPPAAVNARANPNPTLARPKPQFGASVIALLKYQYPSVKVCYGCGGELMKPGGCVTNPPSDLVIVSGNKRSYYDTKAKQIKQGDAITNIYFHLTPTFVTLKHRYFIAGLIKAPGDLISLLLEEHKDIIEQITGVSVP